MQFTKTLMLLCLIALMPMVSMAQSETSLEPQTAPTLQANSEAEVIQLLKSDDFLNISTAARRVHSERLFTQEVLDVVAEVLLQRYSTASESQFRTLDWLMRSLGRSKNGRYFEVFEQIGSNASHRTLRKSANKYQRQLIGSSTSEQFQPGLSIQ